MAIVKIYKRNYLAGTSATLKNGTGGGAPAISEDPDWPMSNLLVADRYSYWKINLADENPGIPVDFDIGFAGSFDAAGFSMMRAHGSTKALPTLEVFSDTVYPMTSPVSRALFDLPNFPTNNGLQEFSTVVARYWSFSFTSIEQFSCNVWLVAHGDIYALLDYGEGTINRIRKIKRELRTAAGGYSAFVPGQSLGSSAVGTEIAWPNTPALHRDALRDAVTDLDTRFMVALSDGRLIEATLKDGAFQWLRRFDAPALYDMQPAFQEHP